jgi:hypothetical protein
MKRELSGIEKLEAVKKAMEAFGFDFSEMTVGEAFAMYRKIQMAIEAASKDLEVLK